MVMNKPESYRINESTSDISSRTLLVGLLLCVTCLYANLARNSFTGDFNAYYIASLAMRDHLDPYLNHAFVGPKYADVLSLDSLYSRFIYPPSSLILLRPLAVLSFKTARVFFATGMALVMVGTLASLHSRFPRRLFVPLALFVSMPMFLNVENGQIDCLILALLLISFSLGDGALAGVFLGLAIAIKAWPVLAAFWFFSNRRWKTLLYSILSSAALVLFSVLRWGLVYWKEFAAHLRTATNGGPLSPLPVPEAVKQAVRDRSLDATINVFAHRGVYAIRQNPLRYFGSLQGAIGFALVLALLIWFLRSRRGRRFTAEQSFYIFLAVSLLANHALWATGLVALFPLTMLLIDSSPKPNRAALLLLAPLFLPYQVLGAENFLVWLVLAGFCIVENGWLREQAALVDA